MVRQTAKRWIERLLRLVPRSPRGMGDRSLILAYHNVVPDELGGLGDRPLHLPFSVFVRQLDLLQAHCRVISLAEMLDRPPIGEGMRVAITFDDAYRGAVELALPELGRRGLPSTLFVAPGLLGAQSFWWDDLAQESDGLAPSTRQQALDQQEGRDTLIRTGRTGPGPTLPSCYGCAEESQVHGLDQFGVTLGAHTWSHPNLARVTSELLTEELVRPLEWLQATDSPTLPILAYPYGLASPAVEAAAEQAGYEAGLLVDGGWFTEAAEPWRIPRYNIPAGLSEDGLMLRLSGVLSLSTASSVR